MYDQQKFIGQITIKEKPNRHDRTMSHGGE
jgi:hypothetical protein